MATEYSRQLAAQAWCCPAICGYLMDVELADEFANIMDKRMAQLQAQIARRISAWFNREGLDGRMNRPDFELAAEVMATKLNWNEKGDFCQLPSIDELLEWAESKS